MKGYKKNKNGFTITVLPWSNIITVSETATGKVIQSQTFTDHIVAVTLAKKI